MWCCCQHLLTSFCASLQVFAGVWVVKAGLCLMQPPVHMPLLFESNMCMLRYCCQAKWRAYWFSLKKMSVVAGRLAMFGFSSALIGGGL